MAARHVEGAHAGSSYAVVATSYVDTIYIQIYKNEKLGRVFRCQLLPQPGGVASDGIVASLEPERLMGGRTEGDISGGLYTEMVGSLILRQNPDESRAVVLSLGDVGPRENGDITKAHREELLFVIKLVQDARVW